MENAETKAEIKSYKFDYKEGAFALARVWVVFILIFVVLRIPPLLCIILGMAGGLAARQIAAYWRAEEVTLKPDEIPKPAEAPQIFTPVGRWLGRIPWLSGTAVNPVGRRRPRRLGQGNKWRGNQRK